MMNTLMSGTFQNYGSLKGEIMMGSPKTLGLPRLDWALHQFKVGLARD